MLKSILIAILVATTFIFQGCLPVTQPFVPEGVHTGKALVYIYRPENFLARGVTWSVNINDKEVSNYFINNGYIVSHVNTGEVKIDLTYNTMISSGTYDTLVINNVVAGKTYYVKAVPGLMGFNKLKLIPNDIGTKEIRSSLFYVQKK